MSFGGFGGVPRNTGRPPKPQLGVVQGPIIPSKTKLPDLGPVKPFPHQQIAPQPGLGVVPGMIFPLGASAPTESLDYVMGPLPVFYVVILSKWASNLKLCLQWLFTSEPGLPHDRVIVIDDGAGKECRPLFPHVRYIPGAQPFVFARNANLGIKAANSDIVLLNDDAHLISPDGLSNMARVVAGCPPLGLCSSALWNGIESGNGNQVARSNNLLRAEHRLLTFVCVYIPKKTIERIGLLDEQFVGYGYEDNDYCRRVQNSGLRMGIYDACVVDHGIKERSTFRTRPDYGALITNNRLRFEAKWGRKA